MTERLNKQLPVLPTRSSVGSRLSVGRRWERGEGRNRRGSGEGGAKAEKWERGRLQTESQPLLAGRSLWRRSLARPSPVQGSPQALSRYTSQAEHRKARGSQPPPASTTA